jgi:hypothetical protein
MAATAIITLNKLTSHDTLSFLLNVLSKLYDLKKTPRLMTETESGGGFYLTNANLLRNFNVRQTRH